MPLQDTGMFDEPNTQELHEAGRPGDPATELALDLGQSSADPVVTGENKKALDSHLITACGVMCLFGVAVSIVAGRAGSPLHAKGHKDILTRCS